MTRYIAKCTLDAIGEEGVRWNKGSAERSNDYNLFYSKGIKSPVRDRLLYIRE
jgi:hypothetical protein